MRVLLDTNILARAAGSRGGPAAEVFERIDAIRGEIGTFVERPHSFGGIHRGTSAETDNPIGFERAQ